MKIVIFGSGLIGSQVASKLGDAGHDVKALGRADGIDTTTGEGLFEAVTGADVVVDLTNSPSWSDDDVMAFFRDGTGHILAAEDKAGVGHHVILSIVGADRLSDSGYMRAKVAQEDLVKAGPIPYSIVSSTSSSSSSPELPMPGPWTAQSMQRRRIFSRSRRGTSYLTSPRL